MTMVDGFSRDRATEGRMAMKETQLTRLRKINATVIPARRKSVKRMMFEAVVKFISGCILSQQNPEEQNDARIKPNSTVGLPCTTNIKRLYPYESPLN